MKTTKQTTNDLRYSIVKTKGGLDYHVKIHLNDECKNGHNDFSITGMIYKAGKTGDKYCEGGGAIGDTLAKLFPDEFELFNDLHLCDVNGAPMYAIENGFYFIQNEPQHIKSHFRVNDKEAEILKTAEDRAQLVYMLEEMGIIKRWKEQANEGIKRLEELTGLKFKDDSTRLQKIGLGTKEKAEILSRINGGYYNPEKIQERKEQAKNEALEKELKKLEEDLKKDIEKHTNDYLAKKAVLLGGLNVKNFIYYNHTNEGVFNWNTSNYNKAINPAEFEGFIEWIELEKPELPKGIIFKIKEGK